METPAYLRTQKPETPAYLRAVQPEPPQEEPGYGETIYRSGIRGTLGLLSGAGAASEWAGDITGVQGLRSFGQAAQDVADAGITEGAGKLEGESFTGTFMENPSLKRGVGIVAEAVPSLGAALITGGGATLGLRGLGMATKTATKAGTGVAAGGLGLVEGAPQYIEAKEAGKSKAKASAIGVAATVGTAALEYLGLGKIFGLTGKGFVKGGATGVVTEGLQEGTQQLWQNIVAKVGYDKSRSLVEGMAEAIIGGSGAGGIAGAVTGRINAKPSPQRDAALATLISNVVPNAETTVENGFATINVTAETGSYQIKAPAKGLADALAAGVSVEELAAATDTLKVGVEATKDQVLPQKPNAYIELPETETTIGHTFNGKPYVYAPIEGMTKDMMKSALKNKSNAAKHVWLEKNAIRQEVPDAQDTRTVTPEGAETQRRVVEEQGDQGIAGTETVAPTGGAYQQGTGLQPGGIPAAGVDPNVQVEALYTELETLDAKPTLTPEETQRKAVVETQLDDINAAQVETQPAPTEDEIFEAPPEVIPEGQTVAAEVSPDVKYKGSADGLHYFDITKGDGEGTTFATESLEAAPIKAAMQTTQAKFATKPTVEGNTFTINNTKYTAKVENGEVVSVQRDGGQVFDKAAIQRIKVLRENVAKIEGQQDETFEAPAYHGTPHRGIEKSGFSTDKIGTGEGNQAFGWGLYFAGKRKVAEWYRKRLSGTGYTVEFLGKNLKTDEAVVETLKAEGVTNPIGMLSNIKLYGVDELSQKYTTRLDRIESLISKHDDPTVAMKIRSSTKLDIYKQNVAELKINLKILESLTYKEGGQLYKVEIPEDTEMLHDHKPMSEQPVAVRKALGFGESRATYESRLEKATEDIRNVSKEPSGLSMVRSGEFDNMNASDKLRAAAAQDKSKREKYDKAAAEKDAAQKALKLHDKNGKYDTGEEFYKDLTKRLSEPTKLHDKIAEHLGMDQYSAEYGALRSDRLASAYLNSLGIPGLKYPNGEGTGYNYVIFDDKVIDVTETFYEPGVPKPVKAQNLKTETTLGAVLEDIKKDDGTTGKLATFMSYFIPESKLDIKTIIDPTATTAKYTSGKTNTVTLRDPSNIAVSLHEITHAVTVREMENNPALKKKVTDLMDIVRKRLVSEGIYTQELLDEIAKTGKSKAFKSKFGENIQYAHISYGLLNEKEFLAQAMGSKQMQDLLKQIKIRKGGKLQTAWDAFIDMITKALGITGANKTAFGESLSLVAQLAQSDPIAAQEAVHEALFSGVDETLKKGSQKITQAAKSLASPKSKLYDIYVQHAPKWLAVTPLHTLVQTFGKNIKQIRDFATHLDAVTAAKTEIVDNSAVLNDEVEKLLKVGKVSMDTFNKAAATASFNRMVPWKTLHEQDWVDTGGPVALQDKKAQKSWTKAGMQKATGLSFAEAYQQSKNAYDALKTPELKEAYVKITEHLESVRTREKNNLLVYIEKASEEGSDLRKELMAQFELSFNDLYGAYWPLSRVGDYILEYTDTEGFRTVEHFTTIAERKAEKEKVLGEGVDKATIQEDYKDKPPKSSVAIPKQLMGQLSAAVEKKYLEGIDPKDTNAVDAAMEMASQVTDDMNQIWLRWQPETSALKNSVKRKNVKGFSMDMLRSYLDYMQRHASNVAWSEQGRKIDDDIKSLAGDIAEKRKAGEDTTMDRHLLNDLRNRVQALREVNVGKAASVLGRLSTGYYMTSPSIALVQMSQLGALTFPKLATTFGLVRATAALSKGTKAAFSQKYTRKAMFKDPIVNNIYDNLHSVVTAENRTTPMARGKELGDPLYSKEQIAKQYEKLNDEQKQLFVLRESMARNLLDITAAHEAYELTDGKDPKSVWNKAFRFAMLPMSLSELTSRKAAILSTMDLATQDKKDFHAIMSDVAEVVNDTLYSYSKENKGSAMQGGMVRVLLQFQHYRIMTGIRLAMLFKNSIRGESPKVQAQAAKEFVGIMGMTGAFAGALGIPFAQTMFAILNVVLGDDDEPVDTQLQFTNWLTENLGDTAGAAAATGLPTLAGANLSRRIGLADIYGSQNDPPSGLHGKQLAAWWAASQLGPAFSVGSSWVQGYDEMVRKGNFMKGLEVATPKPIRDALKAYRIGTEGLNTSQGKKLLADGQIGADELILTALGFNADEVAKAQSAEQSLRKISATISERRGKLIREAARAIADGEYRGSAMQAIMDFNRKMPAFAIKGGDVKSAFRKIIKGGFGATGRRERTVARQYEVPIYMR